MADDGTVTITIGGAVDSSLTGSAAAAKSSLNDLAASGETTGEALGETLAGGFKSAALAALNMAGEVANLGDKLSSNDIVGAATQIATIAASFSELGAAALGPVGAVAALAGGVAYLGERALQSADDLQKVELSGLGTKGFVASEQQIKEYIARLDELPEVSSDDAAKVVTGFQTMENRSQASMEGLSAATEGWADTTHQSLLQAGGQLREVFGAPLSAGAERFMAALRGVTQAQIAEYEQARQAGNIYGAQKVMLEALGMTLDAARGKLEAHSASIGDNWRNLLVYAGILTDTYSFQSAQSVLNEHSKVSWDGLAAGIRNAIAAYAQMPASRTLPPAPKRQGMGTHRAR
jgi:hypothetical protein